MYAATYGRSIWISDLYPPNTNTIPYPDTVFSSTIWNGRGKYLTGSVYIKEGATLSIVRDTIHMPKNGAIYVEQGAHLIIDSSLITNDCDQCMWQGIVVMGSLTAEQAPATQGWVTVKRGSTLQHAQKAFTNVFGTTHSGAIIQATNSYFINNRTTLDYETYHNRHTVDGASVLYPNYTYFRGCTFATDNNYKGDKMGLPMSNEVYLRENEGINFLGCTFVNRDSSPADSLLGEGIRAVGAAFHVGGTCPIDASFPGSCTTPIRSRFCGFANGIDVQHFMGATLTTSIDNTDFDSVSVGVYNSIANNVSITRCNFTVGNGRGVIQALDKDFMGCYQKIGIYSQNTTQFRIEGNTFTGTTPATGFYNFGVVAANTTSTAKVIYRNMFTGLTIGACAIGYNTDSVITVHGLQIGCNQFKENTVDVQVAQDNDLVIPQGIAQIQEAGTHLPTGNTFDGSVKNIVNNGRFINYKYAASDTTQLPQYNYGSGSVFVIPMPYTNTCYPTIADDGTLYSGTVTGTGGLDVLPLSDMKQVFYTNTDVYNASLATYNSLIDMGRPDSLYNIIATDTSAGDLYKLLETVSPYLSVKALMQTADLWLLDSVSMAHLLIQNPDNLYNVDFMNYVANDYGFSGDDMDTIMSYANTVTARTALESTLHDAQLAIGNSSNLVMMALKTATDPKISIYDTKGVGICTDTTSVYYTLDSNTYYAGLDSVDAWLQNLDGIRAWYDRVGYNYWLQDYKTADDIMKYIPTILGNYQTDKNEYSTYYNIWNVLLNAATDKRDYTQLTKEEIEKLDTNSKPAFTPNSGYQQIFNLSTIISSGMIVPSTANPCYYTTLPSEKQTKGTKKGKKQKGNNYIGNIEIVNGKESGLQVHPNPTNSIVNFDYNLTGGISFTITNIVGEKVWEQQTTETTGKIMWDSRLQPAGVYVYCATDGQGVMRRGKIVVVR